MNHKIGTSGVASAEADDRKKFRGVDMRLFFGLVTLALGITVLSAVTLAWDGSWLLFYTLDKQFPGYGYGRLTMIPLEWLVVQASHYITNTYILGLMFSSTYAALTLVALLVSWWVVHDGARYLFVWAVIGIGLVTLPAQVCAVCQAVSVVQLFWPILLAILVGIPRRPIPVIIVLAVVISFFHPTAVALFAIGGVVAFVVGWRDVKERRAMWLSAGGFMVVALIAAVRTYLFLGAYETEELSLTILMQHFYSSLAGLPIIALALVGLAAAFILFADFFPTKLGLLVSPKALNLLSIISIALAGILLLYWARDTQRWAGAYDYRHWVLFVSIPFFGIATVDAHFHRVLRTSGAPQFIPPARAAVPEWNHRAMVIHLGAIIFVLVLAVQSFAWFRLTSRLRDTLANSPTPCISASTLTWLPGTVLDHWSLSSYSLLVQRQPPEKIVVRGVDCSDVDFSQGLPMVVLGPQNMSFVPWQSRWFNFQSLERSLTAK